MREKGKRIRVSALDVRVLMSELPFPRIGIVVPRFGKTAVERNRLKRRLRELVRTQLLPSLQSPPALDVLVRATPAAYRETFSALQSDIARLAARLAPTSNS